MDVHEYTLRRLLARTEFRDHGYGLGPCWVWTGALDGYGNGLIHGAADACLSWVHGCVGPLLDGEVPRVGYALLVGAIPVGLELYHLCGVHVCWCPDHLKPVTREERSDRGAARCAAALAEREYLGTGLALPIRLDDATRHPNEADLRTARAMIVCCPEHRLAPGPTITIPRRKWKAERWMLKRGFFGLTPRGGVDFHQTDTVLPRCSDCRRETRDARRVFLGLPTRVERGSAEGWHVPPLTLREEDVGFIYKCERASAGTYNLTNPGVATMSDGGLVPPRSAV